MDEIIVCHTIQLFEENTAYIFRLYGLVRAVLFLQLIGEHENNTVN